MKSNRFVRAALGAALLAFLLGACGPLAGSAPTATPAPTARTTGATPALPTAMPLATVAPTAPPAGAPTAAATGATSTETREVKNVGSGLEKLKSYSIRASYTFDGKDSAGQPQKGLANITQEVVNTTKDMHLKLDQTGDVLGSGSAATPAPAPNTFEVYNVNSNTFLIRSGKCQFLASGDALGTLGAAMITPDQFIGANKGTLVRRGETVNGVPADHFTVTEAALSTYLAGMKLDKGDVWISPDGYVVKLVAQVSGTNTRGSTGTGTFNYDVENINTQPAIVLPGDCVAPVQAADIPFPSNITDKRALESGGQMVTTFKSADAAKTVADFYRKEMPAKGWKLETDRATGETAVVLTFSKDNGKRTVTVNILNPGGGTNVIITDKTTP